MRLTTVFALVMGALATTSAIPFNDTNNGIHPKVGTYVDTTGEHDLLLKPYPYDECTAFGGPGLRAEVIKDIQCFFFNGKMCRADFPNSISVQGPGSVIFKYTGVPNPKSYKCYRRVVHDE